MATEIKIPKSFIETDTDSKQFILVNMLHEEKYKVDMSAEPMMTVHMSVVEE